MYQRILNQATEELKKQEQETKSLFLKDGYDFVINRYLTQLRQKQLKNGEITEEEAKAIATKKLEKETQKRLTNITKNLELIEQAEDIEYIKVSVEWKKSRTWGSNPTAEVWAREYTKGTASGCGYDKESSAIAEALNKNKKILKLLCDYKEKELAKDYNITSEKALGYGSGYGVIPYFEGGVGASCHVAIFKKLGFKCDEMHGKMYDAYKFTKEATTK